MFNNEYSVDGFRKWIKNNDQEPFKFTNKNSKDNLIGMELVSKLSLENVIRHMDAKDGNIDELAAEFCEQGGSVIEVKGKTFLIELDSGSFTIKRCFVKKKS
jgi:hypothetical protein